MKLDNIFTGFLRFCVWFIRLFIPKPKFGSVNMNKIDKENKF